MTIINANTKRGQNFIQSAYYYEGRTLADVYASPSHAKQNAFDECRALCYAEGGENFRIISHNTFAFSVACSLAGTSGCLSRVETAQGSYFVRDVD